MLQTKSPAQMVVFSIVRSAFENAACPHCDRRRFIIQDDPVVAKHHANQTGDDIATLEAHLQCPCGFIGKRGLIITIPGELEFRFPEVGESVTLPKEPKTEVRMSNRQERLASMGRFHIPQEFINKSMESTVSLPILGSGQGFDVGSVSFRDGKVISNDRPDMVTVVPDPESESGLSMCSLVP